MKRQTLWGVWAPQGDHPERGLGSLCLAYNKSGAIARGMLAGCDGVFDRTHKCKTDICWARLYRQGYRCTRVVVSESR